MFREQRLCVRESESLLLSFLPASLVVERVVGVQGELPRFTLCGSSL